MADNNQDTSNPAAAGAPTSGADQAAQGPNFSLQRLYLKDASFESPGGPAVDSPAGARR